MFQNILFPTDGSVASLRAADVLARVAGEDRDTHVTVAVVVEPLTADKSDYRPEFLQQHNAWLRLDAQRAADRATEQVRLPGLSCKTKILEGSPVSAALAKEAASGKYDLIVMSSRGLGQQRDSLRYLGSVTEHLLRRVSIPVLVIPLSDADEDDD